MNSKITVLSEYSFIPLTSNKVEIISNYKVDKSQEIKNNVFLSKEDDLNHFSQIIFPNS